MKISKIQQGLVLVTVIAAMFAAGCELIVDFDRTQIPVETSDSAVPDVNIPDTGVTPDAGGEGGAEGDAGETLDADTDQ